MEQITATICSSLYRAGVSQRYQQTRIDASWIYMVQQEISQIFSVDHLSKPRWFYLKLNKEQHTFHTFFSLCDPWDQ